MMDRSTLLRPGYVLCPPEGYFQQPVEQFEENQKIQVEIDGFPIGKRSI